VPNASVPASVSEKPVRSRTACASTPVDVPPAAPATLQVKRAALIFEGGGMRDSYSSAVANALLSAGVGFDFVCGVSAGSSCTVNFLLRDTDRVRRSFVELALDPRMSGWGSFARGRGFFSSNWIYRQTCLPGQPLPFDFGRFQKSPSQIGIQAFDRDSGETVVWHRGDVRTLDGLMARVQASSSLPLVMPATEVDGRWYYDGGLGTGAGIPLQMALDAGYDRVFAVLTRPRGYRKTAPDLATKATAALFWRHPKVAEALLSRHERYNAELDRLEAMAADGRACIVYADKMAVSSSTTDYARLKQSYDDGWEQACRELPRWLEWLAPLAD
jgi:predicted patatin/cPLA2 family phospholipase